MIGLFCKRALCQHCSVETVNGNVVQGGEDPQDVIFRKTATNYRALLRKMTYEDKATWASSPPCNRQLL